jgi:uncharacterized protein
VSHVTVLRAADRHPQPWKNGGGETREVAVAPPGAGMDDFQWRVSIADVVTAGPFSRFDGIDRTLAVLRGELALQIGNDRAVRLTAASAPLPFPADIPVHGQPIDGSVRDLNVMVRRGRWAAEVRRLVLHAGGRLLLGRCTTSLIVTPGPLAVRLSGDELTLHPFDAIMTKGDGPLDMTVSDACTILLIELSRLDEGAAR